MKWLNQKMQMETDGQWFRPQTLDEALHCLANSPPGSIRPLAGATDLYTSRAIAGRVLDLSAISELSGFSRIHQDGREYLRLGAGFRWADCLRVFSGPQADARTLRALRQVAAQVGGQQVQSQATLVGNVCNASPAADGMPVLLALGAQVECLSARGLRAVPLEQFVLAPRKIALATDEIVAALRLPLPAPGHAATSGFIKLGARHSLVISIAMASASLVWDTRDSQRNIIHCGLALGACSPVARTWPQVQELVIGMPLSALNAWVLQQDWQRWTCDLPSLDDVRASAAYRRYAAGVLLKRVLLEVAKTALTGQAGGEE